MRSLDSITTPTERKLYAVFLARWRKLHKQDYRKPIVRIKTVVVAWDEHIVSLGMSFSSEANNHDPRDPEDKNHYVADPASLDERYIVVSPELALKILALGDLP